MKIPIKCKNSTLIHLGVVAILHEFTPMLPYVSIKIANVLRTGYPGAFGWVHRSWESMDVAGTWDRVSALHIDPGVPMFHAGYDIVYDVR